MGRPAPPSGSGTTCDIWGVHSGDFGVDRLSGGAPIAARYALRGVTGNNPDREVDIRDIAD
jgi:hypothetical protein